MFTMKVQANFFQDLPNHIGEAKSGSNARIQGVGFIGGYISSV